MFCSCFINTMSVMCCTLSTTHAAQHYFISTTNPSLRPSQPWTVMDWRAPLLVFLPGGPSSGLTCPANGMLLSLRRRASSSTAHLHPASQPHGQKTNRPAAKNKSPRAAVPSQAVHAFCRGTAIANIFQSLHLRWVITPHGDFA